MKDNTDNAYMGYQTMISQTNEGMASLSKVCGSLGLDDHVSSLEGTRERMKKKTFSVGIMGEFKRGKSTVINALLGQEIVPANILPATATPNYIRWDAKPDAIVCFKDGTEKNVPVDDLSSYVTKITKESEKMAENVEHSIVYYPCRFCQNGVQIVDTPGLNDDERMNKISEEIIPTLDAIVMVLTYDSPFSMSEADFVRNKVMTSDMGRIIFLVNKIDCARKRDRPRILDFIKNNIKESVLDKISEMYGEDSEEYRETESKLAGIRIFGISAIQALDGRLDDDEDLLEESNIRAFEDALSKLLTEERGMLELIGPVNSILTVAKEARKTIAMRRDALKLDKEELERVTKEGMEKIEESRRKKKAAVNDLKGRASEIYNKLLPELDSAYDRIESQLLNHVENAHISADAVKKQADADRVADTLAKEIQEQTKGRLSESTELLMNKVYQYMGDDMENLQNLSSEIYADIVDVQNKLTVSKNDKAFNWGIVAVDTLTNFTPLFGIGGILSGFRENGIKGAAVGGLAGLFAGGAAASASLAFCGTVLGLAAVPALPIVLIAGIASTFGGRGAVRAVFGKSIGEKNIKKIHDSLKQSVKDTKKNLKSQRVLENWLRDVTNQIYASVAQNLDEEVEATLSGFENTLSQLRLDSQKKESEIEQTMSEMDKLDRNLDEIAHVIEPVKIKLTEALRFGESPMNA